MLSTWTIPTDPGFETRRPSSAQSRYEPQLSESRPRARVRPEAISNAIKNQGSLAQLFNPSTTQYSIRGRPTSAQPKNHAKENIRHIKEIQRANRKKQVDTPSHEPMKAVYKPGKFEHVESKVVQEIKAPPTLARSNSADFLRAGSRNGPPVRNRPSSVEPVVPREFKLSVPKAEISRERRPLHKNSNHISKNVRRSVTPVLRRPPSALAAEELSKKKKEEEARYKRGVVPKYLKSRQEQWKKEEEIRIANIPDPSIPPGHTLMPREERIQTLDALQKNQVTLLAELNGLPVRVDTLRVKTRKAELERKLTEIEQAIKIFSRPKVFVKIDD